jgi:hypothetical protein
MPDESLAGCDGVRAAIGMVKLRERERANGRECNNNLVVVEAATRWLLLLGIINVGVRLIRIIFCNCLVLKQV